MSNTILIKHGTTKPKVGTLETHELGFDWGERKLYIGGDPDPLCITDDLVVKTLVAARTQEEQSAAGSSINVQATMGVRYGYTPAESLFLYGTPKTQSRGIWDGTLQQAILYYDDAASRYEIRANTSLFGGKSISDFVIKSNDRVTQNIIVKNSVGSTSQNGVAYGETLLYLYNKSGEKGLYDSSMGRVIEIKNNKATFNGSATKLGDKPSSDYALKADLNSYLPVTTNDQGSFIQNVMATHPSTAALGVDCGGNRIYFTASSTQRGIYAWPAGYMLSVKSDQSRVGPNETFFMYHNMGNTNHGIWDAHIKDEVFGTSKSVYYVESQLPVFKGRVRLLSSNFGTVPPVNNNDRATVNAQTGEIYFQIV